MALILGDRVKETTTVIGTGTATLLGATTGFQSFSVVGNGNTTYYCIADQGGPNWEVGIGTYTSAGTTLARTTVLASSNAGGLVSFTSGVKDIFVTYPSEKGVWYDASGNVLFTGTLNAANLAYTGTLTGGTGVVAIGTNQIYKDASGKVGINVTPSASTSAKLQVTGGTTNATTLATSYSNAVVAYVPKSSSGYSLAIASGTSDFPQLQVSANGAASGDLLIQPYGGNVGIGTSSPACKLYIAKNIIGNTAITVANSYLYMRGADVGYATGFSSTTGGVQVIQTYLNDSAGGLDLAINPSGGNVGIGTSSPKVNLSLNGAATTTGTANILRLYDDGAVSTSTTSNSCGFGFSVATGQTSYTSGTGGLHVFYTSNTEALRINSTQDVSIPAGQLNISNANSTATGGGQIYLNGATGNRIDFNTNGAAAPAFTTRSVGTKIVLYPSVGAAATDFALGIESNTLWTSVPVTTNVFKWYGGTTLVATLSGTGEFTPIKALRGCYGAGAVTTNFSAGDRALDSNTTGLNTTAVGVDALTANTTGDSNTAVGRVALFRNTTGSINVAVGNETLYSNTIGDYNTAVGNNALFANTTGSSNSALGTGTLIANTTGNYNTAVGDYALTANTTGSYNTTVGDDAALGLTTGSYNQVFGNGITLAAASTGRIAIGSLFTHGTNNAVVIGNGTNRISNSYTVNATWTFSSDKRLKNVIGKDTLGLSFINDLEPVTYRWRPSNEIPKELTAHYAETNMQDTNIVMHGLIAQNVKTALDKAGVDTFTGWSEDEDGTQRLGMTDLITPMINAIKELTARLEALEGKL